MKGETGTEPRLRGVACGVGRGTASSDGASSIGTPHGSLKSAQSLRSSQPQCPNSQSSKCSSPATLCQGLALGLGWVHQWKDAALGVKLLIPTQTAQQTSEHTSLTYFRAPCRLKGEREAWAWPSGWFLQQYDSRPHPWQGSKSHRAEKKSRLTHYAFKSAINPSPYQGDRGQYALRKAVVSVHVTICPCTERLDTQTTEEYSHIKIPF